MLGIPHIVSVGGVGEEGGDSVEDLGELMGNDPLDWAYARTSSGRLFIEPLRIWITCQQQHTGNCTCSYNILEGTVGWIGGSLTAQHFRAVSGVLLYETPEQVLG